MTKITAHAGCEGTPPGSREGIETAIRLGADVVELDLRLWDGVVWLSHDMLDTGRLHTYLTLEQALGLFCGCNAEINCDLKEPEVLPYALETIRKMDLGSRIIFTGEFDPDLEQGKGQYRYFQNAELLCSIGPEGKLSRADAEQMVEHYRDHAADIFGGYNISYDMLTPETLRLLSGAGIPLSCWTVDEQDAICTLLRMGIAYLTTNHVRYAVEQRAACGGPFAAGRYL